MSTPKTNLDKPSLTSSVAIRRAEKKESKRKILSRVHGRKILSVLDHPACNLLNSLSTLVEAKSKDGKQVRFVHDDATIQAARGMLDSRATYHFRIWSTVSTATVSSNVMAGAFGANPIAQPEFSGILSALFDEYRVEKMTAHLRPIAVGGSTSGYDKMAFAVCNDYYATTVPTTWEVCTARAESAIVKACASSGSGFFAYESELTSWRFMPPRTFGLAGTTASIGPYVDIGQSWPGGVLVFAETTASNGTAVMACWREWHLSFRMRR